jgi:hypothetical protein
MFSCAFNRYTTDFVGVFSGTEWRSYPCSLGEPFFIALLYIEPVEAVDQRTSHDFFVVLVVKYVRQAF